MPTVEIKDGPPPPPPPSPFEAAARVRKTARSTMRMISSEATTKPMVSRVQRLFAARFVFIRCTARAILRACMTSSGADQRRLSVMPSCARESGFSSTAGLGAALPPREREGIRWRSMTTLLSFCRRSSPPLLLLRRCSPPLRLSLRRRSAPLRLSMRRRSSPLRLALRARSASPRLALRGARSATPLPPARLPLYRSISRSLPCSLERSRLSSLSYPPSAPPHPSPPSRLRPRSTGLDKRAAATSRLARANSAASAASAASREREGSLTRGTAAELEFDAAARRSRAPGDSTACAGGTRG